MTSLDRIDHAIIREISTNGRISMTALADAVGLSKTPCLHRLRRLEGEGYILGYTAITNPEKLGAGHIAFVQVRLSDTKSAALDAFNRAVRRIPEIEQCHCIAGNFDYLLKVRSRDIADYRRVLGEQISNLPHLANTSTFVVIESVVDRHIG